MREVLESIAASTPCFVELRYHRKEARRIDVEKGRLEQATVVHRGGVGVRVLENGAWGFAATSVPTEPAIRKAVDEARAMARAAASHRKEKLRELPAARLAKGVFAESGYDPLYEQALDTKIALAMDAEARVRKASSKVETAKGSYYETFEDKAIVTSDGASASIRLVRPEFRVSAVAMFGGERALYGESVGVTGGWECLFRNDSQDQMAEKAARTAVDLLTSPYAQGGRTKVILSPSVVGLLVHEAIGHTVEADFVQAGSVAQGKLGQKVASDLVTLCDSGRSEFYEGAGGTIPVDDEGVIAGRTAIIEGGVLTSYLHSRESAARFGVEPTGNARAWEYSDEPLIRMRNTYIEPGQTPLEEMIAGIEDGYLLDSASNGQADATGEFMFAVQSARRIRNGKLAELVRGVTVSGIAFDVLKSVDAVSKEFKWDLGSGHCGKGQPMKVDAGGPYLRCELLLGGQ